MNVFKKAVIGAALALAFSGAQASLITVGGITWDPDAAFDFNSTSLNIHQDINATTGEVSGFGIITALNGLTNFCSSCELTFQFGGFLPVGLLSVPTAQSQTFGYSSGWINVYVDSTPDISNPTVFGSLTGVNTGPDAGTQLWLALVGHEDSSGISFVGATQRTAMTGSGQLDVIGGLAMTNFDTNTVSDLDTGTFFGADLSFSTSFTSLIGTPNKYLSANGTGNFNGNSIPEPESLALVGLGLLGVGALRRRKAAK